MMIIRIGKNTLSFTMPDATNTERPIIHEPYVVKGGISIAANLREAFKTVGMAASAPQQTQVLLETPYIMVPVEKFNEDEAETLLSYSLPAGLEKRRVLYNVIPSLKAVCLFAVNKDLHGVITDRLENVQFIQAMTPVWRHLHQRSYTGHRNKLYGYFHSQQLDLFSFQQNRFKFCNNFEASSAHDALYFLLYVWKQLRLETEHDELHLVGDMPEQAWLVPELKEYLQKVYVINPSADFQEAPATKIAGLPYDLMTLLTKGR